MKLNVYSNISKESEESEIINYLNGVFMAFEILNSFSNDIKSLYVRSVKISQGQTLRKTLKILTHELYDFEITKLDSITNLEKSLNKILSIYIDQQKVKFINKLKEYKNLDFRISEKALASIENNYCELFLEGLGMSAGLTTNVSQPKEIKSLAGL